MTQNGTQNGTQTRRRARGFAAPAVLALCVALAGGCSTGRPPAGGARRINPADIILPDGYRIEAVATGLTFPTGVAIDDQGRPCVTEAGYAWGGKRATPRLLRIEPDGAKTVLAEGDNGPWNGVDFSGGSFFVSQGAAAGAAPGFESDGTAGGRIVRIAADGTQAVLIDHLPGFGDHGTNGPRVGRDGWVYFAQGTATNSGVVGPDNAANGWLKRRPQFHDIPARDVTLAGRNFTSANPLTGGRAVTGAFLPFGTPSVPGQVVKGQTLCTGAILRVRPDGGEAEVFAWGLRNPFGLAFSPDDGLFVTENSYDARGSRPVKAAADLLWHVAAGGTWYGWPDYHAGVPVDEGSRLLLAEQPNDPPRPAATLGAHAAAEGIDFAPLSGSFGFAGEAFVACFGDLSPVTGPPSPATGFRVARVNVRDGAVHDFATNRAAPGPASRHGAGGLERPIALRFTPDGSALYVLDFGVVTANGNAPAPRAGTGVLWRITRE